MAEDDLVMAEVVLPAHLYRYLHANLDPRTAGCHPYAVDLSQRMGEWIRPRVQVDPDICARALTYRGLITLHMWPREQLALSHAARQRLVDLAERYFFAEAVAGACTHRRELVEGSVRMLLDIKLDEYRIAMSAEALDALVERCLAWAQAPDLLGEHPPERYPHGATAPGVEAHVPVRGAVAELGCDPGMQRYLLRCLNATRAHTTPHGLALAEELGAKLEMSAVALPGKLPNRLRLALCQPYSGFRREEICTQLLLAAERQFSAEFLDTVLHFRQLGMTFSYGILAHRQRYEIHEDITPLDTSRRALSRMLRNNGMANKRGRPEGSRTLRDRDGSRSY